MNIFFPFFVCVRNFGVDVCKHESKKGVQEVDRSELATATVVNVKGAEIRGVANWLCNVRKGLPFDARPRGTLESICYSDRIHGYRPCKPAFRISISTYTECKDT